MKLPKLELKWKWRRSSPEEKKDQLVKLIKQGKKKYILKHASLYSVAYIGIKVILDLVTGKLVTFIPGLQTHIQINGSALIALGAQTVLSPLFGYYLANNQWKRYQSEYQKIQDEEKNELSMEEDLALLRKTPVYLRNIQ